METTNYGPVQAVYVDHFKLLCKSEILDLYRSIKKFNMIAIKITYKN